MRVGAETQAVIQASAERYRPVAARGALLFFTMSSLDKVNAMYKFSLNAFVVVFIRGIDAVRDFQLAAKPTKSSVTPKSKLQVREHPRCVIAVLCVCVCACTVCVNANVRVQCLG
jgi:hypothetical protein